MIHDIVDSGNTYKINQPRMSRRLILFTVCVALILAGSWYKARENELDQARQAAWQERFKPHFDSHFAVHNRINKWLNSMMTLPDARTRIFAELSPPPQFVRNEERRKVFTWQHPENGMLVTLVFSRAQLADCGWRGGRLPEVLVLHPQPPLTATKSHTEMLRQFVGTFTWRLWVPALIAAIALRRRGQIAAIVMLILSLVDGAACLVAPNYNLTLEGIFSNDRLFYSFLMYAVSLIVFALCVPTNPNHATETGELRFRLRTLLGFVTLIAILLAIGPVGYVAIAVGVIGLVIFSAALAYWTSVSRPAKSVLWADDRSAA